MNLKSAMRQVLPHVFAIFCFILVAIFYFLPQFQNKTLIQGDRISYLGMAKEIMDYNETHDDEALWTNSMFSGMPAYQIHTPQTKNIATPLLKVMSLGFYRPVGQFILGMLGAYIMLIAFGIRPMISAIFSICIAFGLNNLILLEAGHMTKVTALMSIPLIIAGTLITYRKSIYLGASLFLLGMVLQLYANHYQMTYYLFLSMLFFVGFQFIDSLKKEELKKFAL